MDDEGIPLPRAIGIGAGVSAGTALMIGGPFYCLELADDRTFARKDHHDVDLILGGAIAFAAGLYLFNRSLRRFYG